MTAVWVGLAAIATYELWAILTGHQTWSQLIHGALHGHPIRQVIIFTLIVAIAGHLVFGWFNRHKHKSPAPAPAYDGY